MLNKRFFSKKSDSNKTKKIKRSHLHVENSYFLLDGYLKSDVSVKLKERKAGCGKARHKCSS